MDVKVKLQLNHGYLFDPPHICTLPLCGRRDGRGDQQGSAPLHKLMWGWGMSVGWGGRGKLYMVLITALCSHGCSRYVFMYGSNIVCAQHEEGQRDGGVFPRGKQAHPINSLTLTQSCVTLNEMMPNLFFFFFFFKSGIEQMWKEEFPSTNR